MKNILIKKNDGGSFDVFVEDKYADHLTYDEMLGLISQLTMPEPRRCLFWLKTKEQHEALEKLYLEKDNNK